MKVRSTGKGVSAVSLSGHVYKGIIIVSESGNELGNASHDVLRVSVVLKVLVVHVDHDGVRGSHQEVAISFQASYNS